MHVGIGSVTVFIAATTAPENKVSMPHAFRYCEEKYIKKSLTNSYAFGLVS